VVGCKLVTMLDGRKFFFFIKLLVNQDLGRFAEESLSRDEKRARSMNLPISTDDIINLPMDEFNERLSKYDLSEAQLTLIRDIRRRGKNKVRVHYIQLIIVDKKFRNIIRTLFAFRWQHKIVGNVN